MFSCKHHIHVLLKGGFESKRNPAIAKLNMSGNQISPTSLHTNRKFHCGKALEEQVTTRAKPALEFSSVSLLVVPCQYFLTGL